MPEPGQSLGHYRILRQLGRGGMGVVYLAEDTKLERRVALKVLPPEMASSPERLERFRREAKAVAALNHPHIVTIHSVEEQAGTSFLTMELVEGESLDHVLTAAGLPLSRVFDIGIAVAEALAAAHEKGIVHRDLKPANVIVGRDGWVKVLDFGLAKLAERSVNPQETATRAAPITAEGAVIGTVPYMSPEQLRGQDVDQRSDIFSLGIMLYELATGHRPFSGATNADISSSILTATPPLLSQIKPDLPRHLGRIVAHCLEKEPGNRLQSALDVRNELRALRKEIESGISQIQAPATTTPARPPRAMRWIGLGAAAIVVAAAAIFLAGRGRETQGPQATDTAVQAEAATSAVDPRSIAVLPFVNMSSDTEQEYFSDGISEELLNLLAKVRELRVAARTSSFSFKGKAVEIPEIARQLHVAHILEGSVRKAGNQVRITAQLIHAADGFHLWSETYDRKLDDVFAIQDEIAADVVKQLKVKLLGAAPKAPTTNPEAYALYLQSRQIGRLNTREAWEKSNALAHQALAIDPRFAPAWSRLAGNLLNQTASGLLPVEASFSQIREILAKALEIDPDFAPAHVMLGWMAMLQENGLADAARHMERALALAPADPSVLGDSAALLEVLGRVDESLVLQQTVIQRDPLNALAFSNLSSTQYMASRFDESIASARTALSLNPGQGFAHMRLGMALLLNGDAAGALAEIEQEPGLWREISLPLAYHALGRKADSDAALAQLIAKAERGAAVNIASIYAFRGETDRAFEWFDKAVKYGDPGLADVPRDPLLADLRQDPRWLPFLRRIGRAPEQLAQIRFKVTLPE